MQRAFADLLSYNKLHLHGLFSAEYDLQMATMFKKPKRNFRRKVVADSDSDQENENKLAEAENEENGNFMDIDDDCPDILRAPPPLPLPPPPPIPELKKVKKKKREKELDSSKVKPLSFDTEEDGMGCVFFVNKL